MEITRFDDLNNAQELREEMAEMLVKFDLSCNEYQTDVYLYVDDDGNGELYEFVNVGGNSWLNDDHYRLWIDRQHYDTVYDLCTECGELAEVIGMTEETLIKKACEWRGWDADDVQLVELADCAKYIDDTKKLREMFYEWAEDYLRGFAPEIDEQIDCIIMEFDKDLENQREMMN